MDRPQQSKAESPRFLCDEMLLRLARWLRAAGYDTATVGNGHDDRKIVACALNEQRLLLTRDREFSERRATRDRVLILESGKLAEQVAELNHALSLDWLKAPFSRCLVDNTPLRPAREEEIENLPWQGRGVHAPFAICPACERLYWNGGHTKRMRRKLESWKQASEKQANEE